MKEQTYRNHYKVDPNWKDRIIFFAIWWFYKTFDSDAEICSLLLWFQTSVQNGMKTVWFPVNSWDKHFWLLKKADYSYVVLQIQESWPVVLQYHLWQKSLTISVPVQIYVSLLEDLRNLIQKYETTTRIISPINLWLDTSEDSKKFIPPELPEQNKDVVLFPQNPIL